MHIEAGDFWGFGPGALVGLDEIVGGDKRLIGESFQMIEVHGAQDATGLNFLEAVEGGGGAHEELVGRNSQFLSEFKSRIFGKGVRLADGVYGDLDFVLLAVGLGDGAEGVSLGHDMFVAIALGRFGDGEGFLCRFFFFPLFAFCE